MCGPQISFYCDQMKITQRSLSLSTHCLLCFGRTGLEEKPDRCGEKSEQDTLHRCEVPRFSEMPHSSPVPPSLSLFSVHPSLSFSLSVAFLELSPFSSLPSSLSSLPPLTPDTVLPLGFHPFPPQPACCGSCAVVPSWTACTFFPLLSSLRPLLCTRASAKWISPLLAWLCAVCVSGGVCGWEWAVVSYPAKYA